MKTLLVVDDEVSVAEALSESLRDEGYRVFTAPNGKVGFALLQEHRPDLVLLDLMMPVEDGASMYRRMRGLPEFERVPVIVMSAASEVAVRPQFAGIAAYLRKPFPLLSLLRLVEQVLGAE